MEAEGEWGEGEREEKMEKKKKVGEKGRWKTNLIHTSVHSKHPPIGARVYVRVYASECACVRGVLGVYGGCGLITVFSREKYKNKKKASHPIESGTVHPSLRSTTPRRSDVVIVVDPSPVT